MCGRYTQKEKIDNLLKILQVLKIPALNPRYNISPGQTVPCVRNAVGNDHRECAMLKWGLIPPWAKDMSIGNKMINARSESLAEKPSFKNAFMHRRCLVIADGFYEWKREERPKQPLLSVFQRPTSFCLCWFMGTLYNTRVHH